jgi:hypothetical protein
LMVVPVHTHTHFLFFSLPPSSLSLWNIGLLLSKWCPRGILVLSPEAHLRKFLSIKCFYIHANQYIYVYMYYILDTPSVITARLINIDRS